MSEFELAIPTVLRHEGGFANNANDPGGATKFGISLRWLKGEGLYGDLNGDLQIDIKDIIALTPEKASQFYKDKWWDHYDFGRVIDQTIATKIFDTAVNMGTPRAVRFAQMAVNSLGGLQTDADGQLGPNSILAINSSPAAPLLHRIQDFQAARYRALAVDPKLVGFLAGWLNRAYDRI